MDFVFWVSSFYFLRFKILDPRISCSRIYIKNCLVLGFWMIPVQLFLSNVKVFRNFISPGVSISVIILFSLSLCGWEDTRGADYNHHGKVCSTKGVLQPLKRDTRRSLLGLEMCHLCPHMRTPETLRTLLRSSLKNMLLLEDLKNF